MKFRVNPCDLEDRSIRDSVYWEKPSRNRRTQASGKLSSMIELPEQKKRAEVIIMTLAKLFVVLELSPAACPLCRKSLTHDPECPILLAWSLLDEEQQRDARRTIRTLALSLGCDDSFADPLIH